MKQSTRPRAAAGALGIAALAAALALACSPFGRSYETNGERIYFTATNDEGERIRYTGGAASGFMGGSTLTCAACHGADATGGSPSVQMTRIDAPDIRWSTLAGAGAGEGEHGDADEHGTYDIDTFRAAVTAGNHPDGSPLAPEMPRWQLSDPDLRDLADFLRSLP